MNWRALAQYVLSGAGLKTRLDIVLQILLARELRRLHEDVLSATPDNPAARGYKWYSQADEDGIIQEILSRIPDENITRTFIEIGCGDGLENNTHALALQGFRGVWIDGSAEQVNNIRQSVPSINAPGSPIKVEHQFVDLENIGKIIGKACEHLRTREPDFFSLDIDGNDLAVLQGALAGFNPKVICVEYNARLPPPIRASVPYERNFRWRGDDYFGASLQSFCDALTNYRLVSCGVSGANAFFVREDAAARFAHYTPAQLYQPARYHLMHLKYGHPASFKWLEQVTRARSDSHGR